MSPLESGLAVTPFSLGSAVSSWLAGRLVARWGQWVTITGLALMVVGLGVVALLGVVVAKDSLALAIAFPLLVAGIGGGAVISPNTTLTLASVPSGMSGVASGVLQTGQRLGTAVGTAVLAAVFHAVAAASGATATGFSFAMLVAVILILFALFLALAERSGRIGNRGNTELENFPSGSMASGH
jgi:MFS family permease